MFQKFPYTNSHQLNLDWIVKLFKTLGGGFTGQMLRKKSSRSFDWEWANPPVDGEPIELSYNALDDLPTLNGVTISGDKTSADYNISTRDPSNIAPLGDAVSAVNGTSLLYARADHQHPTQIFHLETSDISSLPVTVYNPAITEAHRVIYSSIMLTTPGALVSSYIRWTTAEGEITFDGSLNGTTKILCDLAVIRELE